MYLKNIRALEAGVDATIKFVPDAHWYVKDGHSICIKSQFTALTGIPDTIVEKLGSLGWEVSAFEMCLSSTITDLDKSNLVHNITELISLRVPTEHKQQIAVMLGVNEDNMVSDALVSGKSMQLVVLCERAVKNLFRQHKREKAWLMSYTDDKDATDKLRLGTGALHQ